MPKFYVFSDVHSFYDEFKDALSKTDYDPQNPEHILISLGDNFDRGPQSSQMLNFLESSSNLITVRGNHEDLIMDLLQRKYYYNMDIQNGTMQTVLNLNNIDLSQDSTSMLLNGIFLPVNISDLYTCYENAYHQVSNLIYNMVNYYETENYIFVHSWIPIDKTLLTSYPPRDHFNFNPNWRNASKDDWDSARWGNPFEFAPLNETNKTIVFGHWHCSTGWAQDKFNLEHSKNPELIYDYSLKHQYEFGPDACFDIYHNTQHNIIGIDACTAYSKKVNILVLEDNLLPTF